MLDIVSKTGSQTKITVLNPVGYPPKVTKKAAAPRLESLDGKTIYLVDCRFDDSIELLKQVQAWFAEHMPSVEDPDRLALGHLSARRSQDLGRDQGERRRRHRRRRPLQQLRAGGRHPRDHARDQIRRADRRAAHRQVRPGGAVGDQDGRAAARRRAPSCRSRSWARPPRSCAPTSTATTRSPAGRSCRRSSRPDHGAGRRCQRGRRSSARRRGCVEPTPKTICSSCSSTTTGPTSCRSCCRPRSASPRCWPRTSRKPDEIVGRMQPTEFRVAWEYTVEKVAVNAVMAGARPEYFPVILALAASEVSARGSTSSSAAAMVVVNGPIRNEIGMNCGHRRDGSLQPRQRHHRPRLRPAVAEPAGRLGARRHLHGLAGQQLHLQQRHLRRERGAQPLGAAARAEGLQADRQHGQHLLRLPLDHLLPRPAREILARARARHAHRHRRQFDAVPAARSDHGAAVHRPRRLRHQGRS